MLESETTAVNFLSFVTLKSSGLSCTLNGSLAYDDFVTCTGQTENIGLLSYADFPNADIFRHSVSTSHTHQYHH